MTKIVIALSVLLLLLLAGNFGLVWAVVVYNTPTTLSSNVLTAKASGDPVQVSSADFYYDSNGLLQLRNRASKVPMDWVSSPAASCSSDDSSATSSTGRRHLLQDTGSTAASSTPTTVDMQTTQFTPTCNFSSPDFYTNSSYFFTGTCTFSKLVQMRTLMLPILSSKTSAQVGGSIIDAAAWKTGNLTVYKGCYNAGNPLGSYWNSNVLNSSTTLADCEQQALNGEDANSAKRSYSYFGFTGSAATKSGTCYACSAANSSCTPMASQASSCTATSGVRVYQLVQGPNRFKTSSPGAMANSPVAIAGVTPTAPAWSSTTLVITRVDYVKNVFRDASNTLTICQANLLRFYVQPMTASGSVTSVSGGNSSYIDICLTPMVKTTAGTTWIGNFTVHSTGKSSIYTNSDGSAAYYDRPNITGAASLTPWGGPNWNNTDFQSQLSYHCHNCPSGPYIDYSNLQYDANLFELPCTKKGISWRYRDIYSNQGCPAWDPDNPLAQSSCNWTIADSTFYGGGAGLDYCIVTMNAFTANEPIFTFDNQLSFLANTGRGVEGVQKTQEAAGDSGVPPLYTYASGSGNPLWKDYFNSSVDATAAVAGYPWFTPNKVSPTLTIAAGSRRHLLQVGPNSTGITSFSNGASPAVITSYYYVGDCANKVANANNGWKINVNTNLTQSCTYSFGSVSTACYAMSTLPSGETANRVCRCIIGTPTSPSSYCSAAAPVCRNVTAGTSVAGCFTYSPQGLAITSSSVLAT